MLASVTADVSLDTDLVVEAGQMAQDRFQIVPLNNSFFVQAMG